MLQIRDLTVTMKKDLRDLLRGFTFALNSGDKAAIIGEEGNGKSTLLKLLYDPALVEGYVEYTGAIQKDGMLLGYLSQEVPPEQGELSAYEFCCQSPAFLDASPGELAAAAKRLLRPAGKDLLRRGEGEAAHGPAHLGPPRLLPAGRALQRPGH